MEAGRGNCDTPVSQNIPVNQTLSKYYFALQTRTNRQGPLNIIEAGQQRRATIILIW
jgi:hypothetical protein